MRTGFNAEMSVIGSIMIDPDSFNRVSEIVDADCFALTANQNIFTAAAELSASGVGIDPLTLKKKCDEHGWPVENQTLLEYMECTPTAANDVEYAKIVRDMATKRKLREMAERILDDENSETSDLLGNAMTDITRLANTETTGRLISSYDMMNEFVRNMTDRWNGKSNVLPTGYKSLDDMLGGGMPVGGMVVIAARTGMGKTSFALSIADKIDGPVLFVSLEMTTKQITAKRLAAVTGISSKRLLNDKNFSDAEHEKIADAELALSKSQVTVNRKLAASISDINIMARSIKGLKCVIVDYLGLVQSNAKSTSRYEKITDISGSLKRLALSLDVPVIALAQINRTPEGSQDKRPQLSHLRDSGAIEQDADAVLLLYREDYYNGQTDMSTIEINLAKNRHGETGKIRMGARLGLCRFYEEAQSN